jgi:hypothetical protein
MSCRIEQHPKRSMSMSHADENVKSDRTKALALAKECYTMKLELLTNASMVNDAIRFVASHTASTITEKANSDDSATVNEEVSSSNDIQGSEESCSQEQQQSTMTNNSIF